MNRRRRPKAKPQAKPEAGSQSSPRQPGNADRIHREMLAHLEEHPPPRPKRDPPANPKPTPRSTPPHKPELMLRRLRYEEALRRLRSFLEFHAGRGTVEVRIVHGKGLRSGEEGPVLKDAVIRFCDEHPQWVRSHRPAPLAEGGDGALMVVLNAGDDSVE